MYIRVSLHLGYYSVGVVEISIEDCVVDSTIVNPNCIFPVVATKTVNRPVRFPVNFHRLVETHAHAMRM